MADWQNFWREIVSLSSPTNNDLKIINMNGNIRLTSGGYTQSKKIDGSIQEGYWSWQANFFDLSTVKNPKVLILGFGGGTIATLLREKFPEVIIDGVDLDPKMIAMGKKYLGLELDQIQIYIEDAFEFVKKRVGKYDLVVVDIFNEGKVPDYLQTEEFFKSIKLVLNPAAAVTINRIFNLDRFFIDPFAGKQEYKKFVKMLERVFGEVEILEVPSKLPFKNYLFKGKN